MSLAPTPTAPPQPTPAPQSRPAARPRLREMLAHAAAALATCAILVAGLGLRPGDLRAPFQYSEDALLILPMVKATVERGGHWRNERLGAPGVQELHDFPVVDHLHFAVIAALGWFFPDAVVVFNLFHLLTYPLATLTAMAALRRLGLSLPAAAAGGVLYAFVPYHQLRGATHYFLAAYYVVPLTLLVALDHCRGRLAFFRRDSAGDFRLKLATWPSVAAILIALATSAAGAYYAFFGCAFLACAGAYGWAATKSWRAAASAGMVVALVVAGGVAQHLPAFAYQARQGANTKPTQRWAEEAEMYGMKVISLVLPIAGHNNLEVAGRVLINLAAVRTRYDSSLRPLHPFTETEWSPLGAVASAGFLGLLAAAVLPGRRLWPWGPLVALTLFGTLLGTVGGAGDLFNFLVTPQIRCHNRISICLAFLALFAACAFLDDLAGRFGRHAGRARWAGFTLLIWFGVWDQTDNTWFPFSRPHAVRAYTVDAVRERVAEKYRADAAFFAGVEPMVPEGRVFCYPVVPFPEMPPYDEPGSPGKVGTYDMVRGYLHTNTVRWSYGAMKGREWDGWQREVSFNPVPRMLERLVLAGFDGLLVDRRGLNPARHERLRGDLDRVLGQGSARSVHEDGTLAFYALGSLRHYLETSYGAARFAAMADAERRPLAWLWLKGWDCYEPVGYERRQRWCKADGLAVVVNPSDTPRRARLRVRLHTWFPDSAPLTISGGAVWSEEAEIDHDGRWFDREIVIPPGRHAIRFRCRPPPGWTFPDSRDLAFGAQEWSFRELEAR